MRLGLLVWLVAAMVAIPVVSGLIGVYQTYQTTLFGQSGDGRSARAAV